MCSVRNVRRGISSNPATITLAEAAAAADVGGILGDEEAGDQPDDHEIGDQPCNDDLELTPEKQIFKLHEMLRQRDQKISEVTAELTGAKHARPQATSVRRLRRARRKDLYVDAPMRDVLGLSAVGLNKVTDAALIQARGTLYKWVLFITQRSLWDGHSTKKNKYRVKYGSSWSKIGSEKRDYLVKRYKARVFAMEDLRPVFFFPTDSVKFVDFAKAKFPPSIFDADWTIQKMLQEALKNERDGRRTTKNWKALMQKHNENLAACERPLVGNSVVRVWRHNRHAHTISRTQSEIWDASPTPGPSAGTFGSVFGSSSPANGAQAIVEDDIEPPAFENEQAIHSSDSEGDVPEEDSEEEMDKDA
ncbi:hypothetical protein QFC20_007410 [Naganishia adeliensis]|uniref:Uncharacterized protein n=1 Tax=Naganishia adeliensis TaxID=92952 RepID=A0ACC2UZM6_9TREE|nr:hypothetical protein QFC20_007410 [Naganishia adeliensis]